MADDEGRATGSDAVVGALGDEVRPGRGAAVPPPVDRPEALTAWQLVSQGLSLIHI